MYFNVSYTLNVVFIRQIKLNAKMYEKVNSRKSAEAFSMKKGRCLCLYMNKRGQ